MFFVAFLAFSSSKIKYNKTTNTLKITDLSVISAKDVSKYKDAKILHITGGPIIINDKVFSSFNKITQIEITATSLTARNESFKGLQLETVTIKTDQANFNQFCFEDTKIQKFIMIPNTFPDLDSGSNSSLFKFDAGSFENCFCDEMKIESEQLLFGKQSFENSQINDIALCANVINFDRLSFHFSTLNKVDIDANTTNFGMYSFKGTHFSSIYNNFKIESTTVNFYKNSFKNSEISLLEIKDVNYVNIGKNAFESCTKLIEVKIIANINISIEYNAFLNCSELKHINLFSNDSLYIDAGVFCGCTEIKTYEIIGNKIENENENSNKCVKDPNPDSRESARVLGDMTIETVYLGTTPDIYFNLQFFVSFMKKLRKIFGKVIPSPELLHSAIWVGPKNAEDDSIGANFVYGKYYNKNNNTIFLWKDGAKGYTLKLREFKKKYHAIEPIKLNIKRKIKINEFIKEIQKSGKWSADDYWFTNTCQHFTSKLIDILQASRVAPADDDWFDLPRPILNSLKSNEKKEN